MIEEHKIYGDCLMGIGIPDGGIAVIDVDRKPVVFDVVWCSDPSATIGGFLKQIIQTGPKPIVHTCYLDQSRNYMFHAPEIFGVVLKVLDYDRNVVWERPELNVPEWISVQDRLPTYGERVLVFDKIEGCVYVCSFDCEEGNCPEGWYTSDGWPRKENEITHWMPFPEPPEDLSDDSMAQHDC